MKKLVTAYTNVFQLIMQQAKGLFIVVCIISILSGITSYLLVMVNSRVIDEGIVIYTQNKMHQQFLLLLLLFGILHCLSKFYNILIYNYIEKKFILLIRVHLRKKFLKKFNKLTYENLEDENSIKIINKVLTTFEQSIRHLFPMYTYLFLSNIFSIIGISIFIIRIHPFLILTLTLPFIVEMFLTLQKYKDVYDEMDTYWNKEFELSLFKGELQSKNHLMEISITKSEPYITNILKEKLKSYNNEYEKLFFKNIRQSFLLTNITKISSIINAFYLLFLYFNNYITLGIFTSLLLVIINQFYNSLQLPVNIIKFSGFHILEYEYMEKYFNLKEEESKQTLLDINHISTLIFDNVWFKYPNSKDYVLKGVSFTLQKGESASIIGANGEGKSTIIKLLLGLFTPNKGMILLNGQPIEHYNTKQRRKLFGTVFQNFGKFNIPFYENIGIGHIEEINNIDNIASIVHTSGLHTLTETLPDHYQTLMGKEFNNGHDVSGGEWQKIAIARAMYGDKQFIILDEPTSNLDPITEAQLYHDFKNIMKNKMSLFITHRLAACTITDKILVLKDGKIIETGTHKQLLLLKGEYYQMFTSQQWIYNEQEAV